MRRLFASSPAILLLWASCASTEPSLKTGEERILEQAQQELAKRTPASLLAAGDLFRKAAEADPGSAAAWAGLAESSALAGLYGADLPARTMPQAAAAAARALELNPEDALIHAVAGLVSYLHEWNWTAAEESFRRALRIRPGLAEAHHWLAMMLSALGRHREALEHISRAAEIHPDSPLYRIKVATIQANAGLWTEARSTLETALGQFPRSTLGWNELGLLDLREGDNRLAVTHFERSLEIEPGSDRALAGLAVACSGLGKLEAARQILGRLAELAGSEFVSPTILAEVHLALGSREKALSELERAREMRDPALVYILTRPGLQPFFEAPEFVQLAGRIGLPVPDQEAPEGDLVEGN